MELAKRFPFTAFCLACWVVLVGVNSVIENYLTQIGRCVQGDAVCLVNHYLAALGVLFVIGMVLDGLTRKKIKAESPRINVKQENRGSGSPIQKIAGRDFYEAGKKKEIVKREANLRFEEYRDVGEGMIGLTVFNDDIADLDEKTAELIGFAHSKVGNKLINSIDIIPPEKRILHWYEEDSKIASGGHSLTYVSRVDWEGIHFCNLTTQHNSDYATWWAGVEIRGKMEGNPTVIRRCCLSFVVRKHILENNREVWLVGHPTLETSDCDWAISLRGKEALKWFEENEQKKSKKTKKS